MDEAGWMWLAARFEPADLLFRSEFSEPMSLLAALPGAAPHAAKVTRGPRSGERDMTVTVPGPNGLVILALVELAGRSAQEGADVWAQEMAAAMRAQGVDAQVAVRPSR